MTEEEFRAQMEGINEGPATQPPPKVNTKPFSKPPQVVQVAPQAYQTRPPTPRPPAPPARRPGGFAGATVPLTVRQSQKDGSFGLAGRISFTIKLDQDTLNHVTTTGEGLAGRDNQGDWQEGWKVGELTVWPPFEKKQG